MKNKKIIVISALGIVIVSVVLILSFVCFHSWSDATCDAPMTCEKCGKTKGEALSHEWIAATCKEAKHCSRCGLTDGKPLAHNFSEATCELPKTCTVCGTTEGKAIGHTVNDWKITKTTSCSEEGEKVGTCDRCKKKCTEKIEKLPHTKGDWHVKKNFIITSDGSVTDGTETIVCTVCKQEIESRKYTANLTQSQKNAAICAYQEVNDWHCGPSFLIYTLLADFESYPVEDAKFVVAHIDVDYDEQAVLYAKENFKGSSRDNLTEEMNHYGFSQAQIDNALKEVGY